MKNNKYNIQHIVLRTIIFVAVLMLSLTCFISFNNENPEGVTYADDTTIKFSIDAQNEAYYKTVEMSNNVKCLYVVPGQSNVNFVINTHINSGELLQGEFEIFYKTFDMTAVSNNTASAATNDSTNKNGDYTYVAGSVKVYKQNGVNRNTSAVVPVHVNSTPYALYNDAVTGENKSSSVYVPTNATNNRAEYTAYNGRYFGLKIYKITYNGLEVTLDDYIYYKYNNNVKVKYDTMYGMCTANNYLPVESSGGKTYIKYYNIQYTEKPGSLTELRDNAKTTYTEFPKTKAGTFITSSLVKTGLAHYYISFDANIDGHDVYQNDCTVGLSYDGWKNASQVFSKSKMTSLDVGIVSIEMDGYPDGEDVLFSSWYHNSDKWGSDWNEAEWSEDSHQFCKYITNIVGDGVSSEQVQRSEVIGWTHNGTPVHRYWYETVYYTYYGYKVENVNATWFGVSATRDDHGANRYVGDIKYYISVRDDVMPYPIAFYADQSTDLTENDYLRVQVRFNEPVQINLSQKPVLMCQLNNGTKLYAFEYETGSGSDTLVFKYSLKNIPEDKITLVSGNYLKNADYIKDFSDTHCIALTKEKDFKVETSSTGTKASGNQWTALSKFGTTQVLDSDMKYYTYTYWQINNTDLKCPISIDARTPKIDNVRDPDSGNGVAKAHDIFIDVTTETVSVTEDSKLSFKVYYSWTTDLTYTFEYKDKTLYKPSTYVDLADKVSDSRYKTSYAPSCGMYFIWVKVVTAFGRIDERLSGPYYFDNTPDNVSNIKYVDIDGSTTVDSQAPTKNKYVLFTVDHTKDYRAYSGQNIIKSEMVNEGGNLVYKNVNFGIQGLAMKWSTSSKWGDGSTVKTVDLFQASSLSNSRGLEVVDVKSESYYKLQYVTTGNLAKTETVNLPTTSTFMIPNTTDANKDYTKESIVTSRTYKICIGYDSDIEDSASGTQTKVVLYNDFDVQDDGYKKVYIGFVVYDGLNNAKEVGSTSFKEGSDYISSKYVYFDLRDVIQPQVSFSTLGSTALSLTQKGGDLSSSQDIDTSVNAFKATNMLTITLTFDETTSARFSTSNISSNLATYTLKLYKPNTKIANFEDETTQTVGNNTQQQTVTITQSMKDGLFTDYSYKDVNVIHTNNWFDYKCTSISKEGKTLTQIVLNSKIYNEQTAPDMIGYYQLYFEINYYDTAVVDKKTTLTTEFYLGSGVDATSNVSDISRGSVFINKVFRFKSGLSYCFADENSSIGKNLYTQYGQLTFSDEEKARDYIKYIEYKDIYLYKIPNKEIATALNAGNGAYQKSNADRNVQANAGQYWIRYKKDTWAIDTDKAESWCYYFLTSSTTVVLTKESLPISVRNAMTKVVETIMAEGSWSILTSYDGLNEYGSPVLDEDCIRYAAESFQTTWSNSSYSSPIGYSGDPNIYNSTVTVGNNDYQLVSTTVFKFNERTNIYITPMSGDYEGYYGKVSSYTTEPIKNIVNDIYLQIFRYTHPGEDIDSMEAPSGTYKIVEVDENGYSSCLVYVDKIAPQLNFEYTVWNQDSHGNTSKVIAEQYYASPVEVDHSINAVTFTITGIGLNGARDTVGALSEIDRYAYIAIYNSNKTELLAAYTTDDLKNNRVTLEDGKYNIEVYDRSGNNYTIPLRLKSSKMTFSVKTVENVYVSIGNRDESDIKNFEVILNNQTVDTTYEETKVYRESGTYIIDIEDWYGMKYSETVTFQREIPSIGWRAKDSEIFSNVTANTLTTVITQRTSQIFDVVTSCEVGFVFQSGGDISVDFISGATEDDFTVYTSDLYLVYELKEAKSFVVNFFYTKYTNVSCTYYITLDITAPQVLITYDQYSYEQEETLDVVRQVKANPNKETEYSDGDEVTPTRNDYKLLKVVDSYVTYGATIDAPQYSLNFRDESGVKSIIIALDGTQIYSGEYKESGNYIKYVQLTEDEEDDKTISYVVIDKKKYKEVPINYNVLTDQGTYTITAYDTLNNKSVFTFTNSSTYEVTYNVDGEVYKPEYVYVYKTDPNTNQYLLDDDGNKIVESKWLFLKNFVTVGEDLESTYSEIERADKDNVANYVRNAQEYTKVEYGNEYQQISIKQNASISYLLTYRDLATNKYSTYFVGIRYENGSVNPFYYAVSVLKGNVILTDEDGNPKTDGQGNYLTKDSYSSMDVQLEEIINKNEAREGKSYTLYSIDKIGVMVTGMFKNGSLFISVNCPPNDSSILTVETKVTSFEASYEPAYFKTMLSLHLSDVPISNEYGPITISEIGSGECIYTNGSSLTVDTTVCESEYINRIMIAYSDVMSFTDYYYLYTTDKSVLSKDMYKGGDGDGYYCIQVYNLFGNIKVYYFAVSNSLLVSATATYLDGWVRDYPTKYVGDIYCNYQLSLTFRSENVNIYTEKIGDPLFTPKQSTYLGSTTLLFDEEGEFNVIISDVYGNSITRHFVIKKQTLALDSDVIYGYNEKALKRNLNYSNKKLSIDVNTLLNNKVKYISLIKGDAEIVIYDVISRTDGRIPLDEEAMFECIGNHGDGEYQVLFRDIYGNPFREKVYYRGTSTLQLYRMTTTSQSMEEYLLDDAVDPSIGFCSNNSLYFKSLSNLYRFTINGEFAEIPTNGYKELTFSTNVTEGKLEYVIYYIDEYGFEYSFKAMLHRTNVFVQPTYNISYEEIDGNKVTRDNISAIFTTTANCVYSLNGSDPIEYSLGDLLRKDGKYVFTVEDVSGNTASYTIYKDTVVYFTFTDSINSQELTNGMVVTANIVKFSSLNGDSSYVKTAYVNGEKPSDDFDGVLFNENGKWEVVIADGIGNETTFMFYIFTHEINYLDYYEPTNYEFTHIYYSDEDEGNISCNALIETNEDGYKHFIFKDAGVYTIVLSSTITGVSINFSITISNDLPVAVLKGVEDGGSSIDDIVIANTVYGDTIYVYKNGVLIDTHVVSSSENTYTISDEGEYRVVIKNIAGNTIEYNFTRKHVANTAGSVLLILLFIAIAVALFVGLLYRNKSRVDK